MDLIPVVRVRLNTCFATLRSCIHAWCWTTVEFSSASVAILWWPAEVAEWPEVKLEVRGLNAEACQVSCLLDFHHPCILHRVVGEVGAGAEEGVEVEATLEEIESSLDRPSRLRKVRTNRILGLLKMPRKQLPELNCIPSAKRSQWIVHVLPLLVDPRVDQCPRTPGLHLMDLAPIRQCMVLARQVTEDVHRCMDHKLQCTSRAIAHPTMVAWPRATQGERTDQEHPDDPELGIRPSPTPRPQTEISMITSKYKMVVVNDPLEQTNSPPV